ncbi:MAG: hypothetical protein R2734_00590 [Nocardioides sp.]
MTAAASRDPGAWSCDRVLAAARTARRPRTRPRPSWSRPQGCAARATGADDPAYRWERGHAVPLAGAGAPEICEHAVAELAAALGVSTDACRRVLGTRLSCAALTPWLWVAVQAGGVPAWRAPESPTPRRWG